MTSSNYYGIRADVIDSYRRNLIFNNTLMLQNFEQRYNFNTDQKALKMGTTTAYSRAASEEAIERFKKLRAAHMDMRKAAFAEKLEARIEPYTLAYAKGMAQFLGVIQ